MLAMLFSAAADRQRAYFHLVQRVLPSFQKAERLCRPASMGIGGGAASTGVC